MRTDLIKSECEFNHILEDMRGVDFSSGRDSRCKRYSYLENMYRDYSAGRGGLIESVPGFRRIYSGTKINGLHLQSAADGNRYLVINDNGSLYRAAEDDLSNPVRLAGNTEMCRDAKSHAIGFKGKLYIGDTESLKIVEDSGKVYSVTDDSECSPYVPTVYVDGEKHEERNLMTAMFREEHHIRSIGRLARGTESLKYRVTDEDKRLCAVSGMDDDSPVVYIPSTVIIAGEEYTVTSIDPAAFSGRIYLEEVYLSDSIVSIGTAAFFSCEELRKLVCGMGLAEIGDRAFYFTSLMTLYVPAAMRRFGESAVSSSATIMYELDQASYDGIEGKPDNKVEYGVKVDSIEVGIKLRSTATEIDSVTLDGEAIGFSTLTDDRGLVTDVIIGKIPRDSWTGKTLSVLATADPLAQQPDKNGESFTLRTARDQIPFIRIIRESTGSAVIGGRLFIWGCRSYPGVVFYSDREDSPSQSLYFGDLDYIDLGDGNEITAVLGFSDGIAIFSRNENGGECIRLYSSEERSGVGGRISFAPMAAYRGLHPSGAAINHGETVLFASDDGLSALCERSLDRVGVVEPRSTAVAAMLSREDLREAKLCRWCGYVVLSVGGRMYLADTRAEANWGSVSEFEWFYLDGVGTYRGDRSVFRYSSVAREGYILSDTPDEVVEETVWSEGTGLDDIIFFVPTEEGKVEVYPTAECIGGEFYPAELTLGFEDRLFFSTGCGDVCVFNNDMRGVPPYRISSDPDFDAEEYKEKMGKRIHPDFYGFHNHAPRYALVTAFDDCGVPHLQKSTVSNSLTLKLATYNGRIHCLAGRDGGEYNPVCVVDGDVTDFSSYSLVSIPFDGSDSVTVALPERERGWVEKSIALYSCDFRAPIGVFSICYRYKIKGRVKNTRRV